MAKRPSFQFYPADWRNNANLRRCSHAARGAWIDILSILHDSDEYGVCRWPLAELANAAGVPIRLIKELVSKHVLKGSDEGVDAFVFRPRHAGKEGDPVTLIDSTSGSCWYCSRFVRDEYIRTQRGKGTRFGEDRPADDPQPTQRIGVDSGYGPSSTSTSTTSEEEKKGASANDFLEADTQLKESYLPRPAHAPKYEDVLEYFIRQGKEPMAEPFFDANEAVGWMKDRSPIVNWQSQAKGWIRKASKSPPKKDGPKPKSSYVMTRDDFYTEAEWITHQAKQQSAA